MYFNGAEFDLSRPYGSQKSPVVEMYLRYMDAKQNPCKILLITLLTKKCTPKNLFKFKKVLVCHDLESGFKVKVLVCGERSLQGLSTVKAELVNYKYWVK